MSISELLSRWETVRQEMLRNFETPREGERYWHPVLGRLTAAQMLELEETHTAYHLRQIVALQRGAA